MIEIPPYLSPGDSIGIVCPAGYMSEEKVSQCRNTLTEWGFQVRLGATVGGSSPNYFSGTDEQRLHDFQQMLDDDSIQAVLCGRGGYGIGRIIDQINFKKFAKAPKWIIGYSDITLLHAHVYSNYKIATIHGPMAGAFNDPSQPNPYTGLLRETLTGTSQRYNAGPHQFDRAGSAVAELVGGNLTMLAHAVGSSSELKTKGRILFLEDIGEYLYNIDRMLHQLKRADKLSKLAGLVVGKFTDGKDTERPYGQNAEEIIRHIVSEYDFPVCYQFPVGHSRENVALKHGATYRLTVGPAGAELMENK